MISGSLVLLFGHGQTRIMQLLHDLGLSYGLRFCLDWDGHPKCYPHVVEVYCLHQELSSMSVVVAAYRVSEDDQ